MYIFLHIPKTAGTSIEKILKSKWEKKINYGRVHIMNMKEIKQIINNRDDNNTILHGHISVDELKIFKIPLKNMFTVIRNPIKRCISWYYYVDKGNKLFNRKIPISLFFSTLNNQIIQNCYNRMTYQLGNYAKITKRNRNIKKVFELAKKNIDKFKFVIVFENLNEDIEKYLDIKKLPKKNITKKYKDITDKRVINKIIKWNIYDIKLYNYALDKLGDKYLKFKININNLNID